MMPTHFPTHNAHENDNIHELDEEEEEENAISRQQVKIAPSKRRFAVVWGASKNNCIYHIDVAERVKPCRSFDTWIKY